MSQKRQFRLGAFIQATGHHVSAWRHPDTQIDAGHNFEHYKQITQTAERGLFDTVFLADSPAVWGGAPETQSRNGKIAHFEPVTLFSALSAVTNHIGFVSTASTTYEEPYILARKFASLDHLSAGRAAWNVVTTGNENAAANFGLEHHPEHSQRYERAEEFIEVVKGLWDSWEDDAFIADRESGVYFEAEKLHTLNHKGKYFSVKGPLNVARPPQGYPVIVQAGASEPGRELAARTAEVIFTANQTLADAQEFYSDVKGRLAKYRRSPHDLKIMPGAFPVIGRTEEEAQEKYEFLQSLIHPDVAWGILKQYYRGVDLSAYSLDDLAPELPSITNNNKSRLKLVKDLASKGLTLRELYRSLATARGHRTIIGTPESIADQLQEWFDNGAADGFNIMPPILPTGLDDFVNLVVPILQKRGLFRTAYEGKTLRENLGLRRPANQYTIRNQERQLVA
ncbi:MAG: LLM class flavin-dependent oxidoreductase [Pseudanabaena sp. M57BS1SP1A06MG]|nr:LLM class flavin-dependent oxidoreductase [Pseudanabaena sp. M53BS1SP1A06MG]MCA6581660.1 LLM class flavin-dependent oxidoreductase [Pseudanabaena sp. M34BS1SP1A06MG]MCA6593547.1 LLM class flavin-dependent oxidoreductase [Pseudanabaena sp. M38BS1SP1A06MG]MCA6601565.1 LLM class flavin-dependent oxidoreductase [Pseudanabaena sp. M57BS1SP1A06MG]